MKKPFKIYFSPDFLFVFLLILLVLFTVLGAVFESLWLLLVATALAAFSVYRVLSGNLAARAKENAVAKAVILFIPRAVLRLLRRLFPDRRHAFVSCPRCGARLRFLKTKGDFFITCPRCSARFPVKTK